MNNAITTMFYLHAYIPNTVKFTLADSTLLSHSLVTTQ